MTFFIHSLQNIFIWKIILHCSQIRKKIFLLIFELNERTVSFTFITKLNYNIRRYFVIYKR